MPKYFMDGTIGTVEPVEDRGFDLSWVDGFVKKIKPHVYVRDIDRLLIMIPNQAYNLNDSGVRIMKYLLKGRSVAEFLRQVGDDAAKRRQIHQFFCDLRAVVSGCLRDHEPRMAIDYHEFRGDSNAYPVLSEVVVTYRCNLRCDFCYVGEHDGKELGTRDLKNILSRIYHEAMIPSVSFTGGEPLTRPDIVALTAHAVRTGLWTNLITNGTLLRQDLVRQLVGAGLSSAQVSIEGPSAAVHDALTGIVGAFEAATRGVEMLRDAGVPVHTNTTLSRNNIRHATEIVTLAKRLGLSRLSMNLVIPCGRAGDRRELWIPYAEIGDRVLEVKRHAEEEGIKFLWYSPVPLCMFNPIAHGLGNKACAAVTGLLSIDPAGNVIPCSSWREPVGSLLEQGFHEIWAAPGAIYCKNADYLPEECRQCMHIAACKGACPLYWRALGKGELRGRSEGIPALR